MTCWDKWMMTSLNVNNYKTNTKDTISTEQDVLEPSKKLPVLTNNQWVNLQLFIQTLTSESVFGLFVCCCTHWECLQCFQWWSLYQVQWSTLMLHISRFLILRWNTNTENRMGPLPLCSHAMIMFMALSLSHCSLTQLVYSFTLFPFATVTPFIHIATLFEYHHHLSQLSNTLYLPTSHEANSPEAWM